MRLGLTAPPLRLQDMTTRHSKYNELALEDIQVTVIMISATYHAPMETILR